MRHEGRFSASPVGPARHGVTVAAAVILAIAAWAPVAGAQETRPVTPAQSRTGGAGQAWVGVGVEEVCRRTDDQAGWSCTRAPVVQSVVLQSPADRAGLLPGDTLISIDGKTLATAEGDEALSRLAVGQPVVLVFARDSERRTVTVEPVARPQQPDMVLARTLTESPAAPERVVSLPRIAIFEDSAAADIEVFIDSAGGRSYAYRFRQPDGSVSEFSAPRIDVPLRLRVTRTGTADDVIWNAYMIAELSRMSQGLPDSAAAVQYYELAHRLRDRYEAEVAPRLRASYDSALSLARVRLDSLRLSLEAMPPEQNADRLGAVRVYGRAFDRAGGRVAGAEFEELNADLADAVGVAELGIDRGLFVIRVLEGTPAANSGLRPGDVVIEAAGRRIGSVAGLRRAMLEDDDATEVVWIRKGQTRRGQIGSN